VPTARTAADSPVAGGVVAPHTGPPGRRLAALCGWAALLGFLGVVIAIRGQVAILVTHPPSWYEPTLVIIGLGGIALTAAAFLAVRQRYTPWLLLTLATAALVASLVATSMVT
jgi:hypothetical protein